jgi:hypothetical protein
MGYRSEVAIVMSKTDYIYGLNWYKRNGIHDTDNLLLPTVADKLIEREDDIIIYYSSIKWYKTFIAFDCIVHLYSLLHLLGSDRFSIVRIGEDYADIEVEGDSDVLYNAQVYPISMIELSEWKTDKEVDNSRMTELINEDKYYHIYCKVGKSKVGKATWLT